MKKILIKMKINQMKTLKKKQEKKLKLIANNVNKII
jgi:hypothetical protein